LFRSGNALAVGKATDALSNRAWNVHAPSGGTSRQKSPCSTPENSRYRAGSRKSLPQRSQHLLLLPPTAGKVDKDQVQSYTARKGQELAMSERWLAPNLGYDD